MSRPVTLKLTAIQARVLWGVIDGAMDAGACEDGLTKAEHKALDATMDQLLDQHPKWKDAKP